MPKAEDKKRKLEKKPVEQPKKVKEEEESEDFDEESSSSEEEVEQKQEQSPQKKLKTEHGQVERDLSNVKTILVNCSGFTNDAELRKHLTKSGKVQKISFDRCFIEYSTPDEAKKAAETLHNSTMLPNHFLIRAKHKEFVTEIKNLGLSNIPSPIQTSEIRIAVEKVLGSARSHLQALFFISPELVCAAFDSVDHANSAFSALDGKLKIKEQDIKISFMGFNTKKKPVGRRGSFKGRGRDRSVQTTIQKTSPTKESSIPKKGKK